MDTLAAMRVFATVVDSGGLSAAGRVLGLAPSTVSRRIGDLEDSLGTTLLRRTTRKLSLTEAGEIYYERGREILRAADEAALAVSGTRAEPSGLLRLTVPSSIASTHIAPAVAAFQHQYPKVRIVMMVTDRLADVVGEGLDVALRIGRLEDSSLVARRVGTARRVLCASPAYLERAGRPAHPMELEQHDCLTFRAHPGSNLWRFRKGDKIVEIAASGPFFSDDGATLVAAARSGLGVILLPEWLVGREMGGGKLVELLPDYAAEPSHSPLWALYAPGSYTPPKIRAFVDFLVARFAWGYDWAIER